MELLYSVDSGESELHRLYSSQRNWAKKNKASILTIFIVMAKTVTRSQAWKESLNPDGQSPTKANRWRKI
jgi:hypothetical protein